MRQSLTTLTLLLGTAALAGPSALPDYASQVQTGKCNHPQRPPGADSSYTGTITMNGDQFSGVELWHLSPNTKWRATGAKACTVVTDMVGQKTEVKACPACEFAITGKAEVNREKTTCDIDLWSETGVVRWTVQYAFDQKPDGSLDVYGNGTGKVFYTGKHAGDGIAYRSKPQCRWF